MGTESETEGVALALREGKIRAEIDKLKAETLSLNRPSWKNPTAVVSILAALGALVTAGFTYQQNSLKAERAALDADRAEYRREQLSADVASLEKSRDELLKGIDEANAENEHIVQQAQAMREELTRAQQALAAVSQSAPANSPTAQQIQQAQQAVRAWQENATKSDAITTARGELLRNLQQSVKQIEPRRRLATK